MGRADECRVFLAELSASGKVSVYLAYAHQLTIIARESYDGSNLQLSRDCNETLHRLTGHLLGLQAGTVDSAAERSFAEMIVASAEQRGWLALLNRSIMTTG